MLRDFCELTSIWIKYLHKMGIFLEFVTRVSIKDGKHRPFFGHYSILRNLRLGRNAANNLTEKTDQGRNAVRCNYDFLTSYASVGFQHDYADGLMVNSCPE